ncbi:MAG: sulfite exporter TauE/SafE family protein [Acidimicrobiia bacterium]
MPLGINGWELVAALAIVVVGGMVQGAIGFGLNLIVVPVLAVIAPGSVPGSMVLISMPMTLTMLLREHHAIDWPGVRWIAIGRLPGTLVGVAVVAAVPNAELAIVVGIVIIIGVVLSVVHPGIAVTRRSGIAAGSVAGITGTAAGVDGPVLALLYQHHEPHTLRATLATCFLIGAAISGTALALAGKLTVEQLTFTAILLPAMLFGLAISGQLGRRLRPHLLRPMVLTFATVAGTIAIGRGISAI